MPRPRDSGRPEHGPRRRPRGSRGPRSRAGAGPRLLPDLSRRRPGGPPRVVVAACPTPGRSGGGRPGPRPVRAHRRCPRTPGDAAIQGRRGPLRGRLSAIRPGTRQGTWAGLPLPVRRGDHPEEGDQVSPGRLAARPPPRLEIVARGWPAPGGGRAPALSGRGGMARPGGPRRHAGDHGGSRRLRLPVAVRGLGRGHLRGPGLRPPHDRHGRGGIGGPPREGRPGGAFGRYRIPGRRDGEIGARPRDAIGHVRLGPGPGPRTTTGRDITRRSSGRPTSRGGPRPALESSRCLDGSRAIAGGIR